MTVKSLSLSLAILIVAGLTALSYRAWFRSASNSAAPTIVVIPKASDTPQRPGSPAVAPPDLRAAMRTLAIQHRALEQQVNSIQRVAVAPRPPAQPALRQLPPLQTSIAWTAASNNDAGQAVASSMSAGAVPDSVLQHAQRDMGVAPAEIERLMRLRVE